jgi:hypothetical protein
MPTSFYDPDGWPAPQRLPQHAATPFLRSNDFRQQAHRALRLVVTAGTWAAGLCLVVGSIVLVVSAASPGRLAPAKTASSAEQMARHTSAGARIHKSSPGGIIERSGPRHASPGAHAARTTGTTQVAFFSGRGDKITRSFVISGAHGWQIQWAYTCPASVAIGLFVVEADPRTAVDPDISQSGQAGHGDTRLPAGGRTHSLLVTSTCYWTMKVMQEP